MLYQLSHFRLSRAPPVCGAESQIRTGDTAIFSRVLYQLSYLGNILYLSVRNFTLGESDCQARYPYVIARSERE